MNNNMWENQFVQENIKKLEENGYNILYPSEGFLACGTNAVGRMREPEEIYEETVKIINTPHPQPLSHKKRGESDSLLSQACRLGIPAQQKLLGKKILITAGGTKEKIDPVRYITNNSSGKMGIALANNAANMGAEVTLVSTFKVNGNFKNIVTETAQEMEQVVKEKTFEQDCVIMAAAVADYRAKNYSEQKIKKGVNGVNGIDDNYILELVKNPDILREISNLKKIRIRSGEYATVCHSAQDNMQTENSTPTNVEESKKYLPIIVGFCAESEHLIENAKIKIKTKGCDFIVANDISRKDIGFNSDENEVYIIDKNLNINHIEKDTKENIAIKILENIFE
jgi:phosphopantothenoylcysteine decarboxylase/phosphopantothenate--cysteine ligase